MYVSRKADKHLLMLYLLFFFFYVCMNLQYLYIFLMIGLEVVTATPLANIFK